MKRIFSIAISLVLIIFSVFGVCATKTDPESTYYIEELGITLYTPRYDAVATRDINKLDISQEEYEEMLNAFEEDDIYFYGYSSLYMPASPLFYDYYTELIIYGYEANTRSLSSLSDILLNQSIEHLNADWENAGFTVVKNEIFESFNTKFILTHITDDDGSYAINYYTIENYKSIDIVMWSYNGEPSLNQKTDLASIINSIEFDEPTGKQVYEETFTFSIAKDGKLTSIGIALIASVVLTLIAGEVVAIILVTKAKKRRRAAEALANQQAAVTAKYCIHCGTRISSVDSFCIMCGKSQVIQTKTENTDNTEQ